MLVQQISFSGDISTRFMLKPSTASPQTLKLYATEESDEYVCYPHRRGTQRTIYKIGDIIDEAYYNGNVIENPELKPFWATIDGLHETEQVGSRRVMDRRMQRFRYDISKENS